MSSEIPTPHDPILLPGNPEFNSYLEHDPITIESLLSDNHSSKAARRRERFEEDEQNGDQVIIMTCSDSRVIITYRGTIILSSIGTGGPKSQLKDLCKHEGAPGIIILPHEDCGGLWLRANLQKAGFPENPDELQKFARDELYDADPLIQVAKLAADVSLLAPDKPVLAGFHKQTTGTVIPLAVYNRGRSNIVEDGKVPDAFENFFKFQHSYAASLKREFSNLEEIQQKQDSVELLVISRDRRPLAVGLPETSRRPGRAFRIFSSRPEDDCTDITDDRDINLVVGQAKYPIDHFNTLNRVLIETESMEASLQMAMVLTGRQWTKTWQARPDTELYVAQKVHGIIENIFKFPLKKAA